MFAEKAIKYYNMCDQSQTEQIDACEYFVLSESYRECHAEIAKIMHEMGHPPFPTQM